MLMNTRDDLDRSSDRRLATCQMRKVVNMQIVNATMIQSGPCMLCMLCRDRRYPTCRTLTFASQQQHATRRCSACVECRCCRGSGRQAESQAAQQQQAHSAAERPKADSKETGAAALESCAASDLKCSARHREDHQAADRRDPAHAASAAKLCIHAASQAPSRHGPETGRAPQVTENRMQQVDTNAICSRGHVMPCSRTTTGNIMSLATAEIAEWPWTSCRSC